jgi:hypothetical protein
MVKSTFTPMEDLPASQRRKFTGRTCSLHLAPVTAEAVRIALARAEEAVAQGRLLNPTEAMALALGTARDKETLFSLARTVAWETGAEQADILCRLGERYPEYA